MEDDSGIHIGMEPADNMIVVELDGAGELPKDDPTRKAIVDVASTAINQNIERAEAIAPIIQMDRFRRRIVDPGDKPA